MSRSFMRCYDVFLIFLFVFYALIICCSNCNATCLVATNPGLMPKHAQHRAPEELEALDTLGDSLNVTAQQPTKPSER